MRIAKDSLCTCTITTIEESKRASEILCNYLKKITGGDFIVSATPKKENNFVFTLSDAYADNGFSYKIIDNNICFTAKNEQAFVYAVYDFLENIIGCRYYSSDCEFIPSKSNLEINFEPYSFVPTIDYREIYYRDFDNKYFSEKLKMAPSAKHEGWGFWCHSFQILLPNSEYFNEHPEYFALIDGERHPKGEPCLSNPNVRRIIKENLNKFMEDMPKCKYWSVSQNDDNLYCRCEACQAKDNYDESQMGSILDFVNEVASEHPDKVISTLAYWYSRKPPKHTKPADNVHIMVCNIEANRGLPIETDAQSIESKEELTAWSKICGNVSLWDYNIQFANLVSPFPNLRTLGPNMRFFVNNNLKLLFSQCNREIGGEFAKLRGYMLAKLAWDPSCDEFKHMEDFCNGYYGDASPFILDYIKTLHDTQQKYNSRLDIFGGPKSSNETYMTLELYNKYNELFDKAYEAVNDNEDMLLKVQEARLPLYYAGIVLEYGTIDERITNIRNFAKIAKKVNLEKVEEWKITVEMFITQALIDLG